MDEAAIINAAKQKALEIGTEYLKNKVDIKTEDVLKYVEKIVEQKIKNEIRKFIYSMLQKTLLIGGVLVLILGSISLLIHLIELPVFLIPIFFGLTLITISIIMYIQK